MKSPWTDLPPPVARHVKKQLVTVDWDAALQQLREVCKDCPAREMDDENICLACPFEGLAVQAATITLKARIAGIEEKAKRKHNI